MDSYEQRLESLFSVSTSLKNYLASLPAESWLQPSACDRWQVADVVAHLAGGAEGYTNTVSRGLQGDTSPPPGRMPAGADAAESSADRIASSALSTREQLGSGLLSTFDATDSRLNQLLAGLSPQDRDKPCYHGGGIVPAENFIDLRLNELAIHEWDIRSSLELEAHVAPEGLPSTLLLLSRSLAAGSVRWAFWPGPKLSTPVRYRFEVAQPVPIRVDIVVQGDRASVEKPGEIPANVSFSCDTETFVLVMYGRVSAADAIASGRLSVAGDSQLAVQFNQWFKGI